MANVKLLFGLSVDWRDFAVSPSSAGYRAWIEVWVDVLVKPVK